MRWVAIAAAACGAAIWLQQAPWQADNPVLALIAIRSPLSYQLLAVGYAACWIATPYYLLLFTSTVVGLLIEKHGVKDKMNHLPPWPEARECQLVIGEVHRRTRRGPHPFPEWLIVPQRGLYTGVAIFGAVGSGKTSCCMYPYTQQIMGCFADDASRRTSGLVLEVKGDFCHAVRKILADSGRGPDYVELSLDGQWCYNPLESDLDAYSLSYQIASLVNQLFGKGKEPFWQQAYTNLVKFAIQLHRLVDDYVTLQDVYRTVLDEKRFEQRITDGQMELNMEQEVRLDVNEYTRLSGTLPCVEWQFDQGKGEMYTKSDPALLKLLKQRKAGYSLSEPTVENTRQRSLQAVITWFRQDWQKLDTRLRSSIIEGISVFLSLFDQPEVADIFCPPREAYRSGLAWHGRKSLPPMTKLLEEGRVLALNLPVGANPALGRAIGVMLKQDFQRAVLARIPLISQNPEQPWRDIAFICDEYHAFATVGENDPGGDEKFFSLSRQAKLIALVATQSVSSLRSALPGESWRTLLQTFRTRIFLTLTDEVSCRHASEYCGQAERLKEQYSISESSQSGVGLLSGRAGGGKGSYSVTKSFAPRREPLFAPSDFSELHNVQSIVAAYDGINPVPATYCYLKPCYLPRDLGYFEAIQQGRL